ncbi:GNAT family protein [Bdellovibrio sp. 22V]|uniref:GNAT family N-acetyltransferase n=1 Tax=Bdellovibrio TaxID=958 RepID=UPI00254341B9|nr:GNAT family protein [Bdellovibrio sp. 22V]WII73674.1 GNAT family protein [Bdellovibrio sp. 22V]
MKSIDLPLSKTTKRLIIRPLEEYDFENWAQAHSSMRSPQNEWDETNWDDSELTLKKFKAILKEQKQKRSADHFYDFGIFRKDDGILIGTVSLMDISRGVFQNAYLGYRIYNNFWGHGYAQEACKAAFHLAFKNLKLHRLEAGIAPSNKKSIKTAKALGLRKEGLSKKRLLVNKKWKDMLIYAITKEDLKSK